MPVVAPRSRHGPRPTCSCRIDPADKPLTAFTVDLGDNRARIHPSPSNRKAQHDELDLNQLARPTRIEPTHDSQDIADDDPVEEGYPGRVILRETNSGEIYGGHRQQQQEQTETDRAGNQADFQVRICRVLNRIGSVDGEIAVAEWWRSRDQIGSDLYEVDSTVDILELLGLNADRSLTDDGQDEVCEERVRPIEKTGGQPDCNEPDRHQGK